MQQRWQEIKDNYQRPETTKSKHPKRSLRAEAEVAVWYLLIPGGQELRFNGSKPRA